MNILNKTAEGLTTGSREYLTFRLGAEEYGDRYSEGAGTVATSRPHALPMRPNSSRAWSIRGTIVPIVDMRLRFNCSEVEYNAFTVVIILNLGRRVVGIVVDSVSDVMELAADAVRPAPDIESAIDSGCILGLGSVGERMLILLDIEKLMGNVDMGLVASEA